MAATNSQTVLAFTLTMFLLMFISGSVLVIRIDADPQPLSPNSAASRMPPRFDMERLDFPKHKIATRILMKGSVPSSSPSHKGHSAPNFRTRHLLIRRKETSSSEPVSVSSTR
ncbi:hypothetical protein SLEP1_g7864 [Rubroshorea leprosula]|uniref:Transmembrane protein n=1 Tax=Rubroshorea leprosula TaxID=152421 RepID=A0AAV5I4B9_9ROSI|nr:hypothetical protein SLEP1_g7864 [Rubroshorea leprosula]